MKYVLLTDAQQRKTLAVARSLGSRGIKVITAEETRFTPASFSKYCSKHLVSPNPQKEPELYYEWLQDTLTKYPCELLIPMDDATMQIATEHREALEGYCAVALPPDESYKIAADKGLAIRAANEAGLTCPETLMPDNLGELSEMAKMITYPAVIKPRKSSGSRGIRVVRNQESLLDTYLYVHREYPYPLIQEYVDTGNRYDVCLFYDKIHQPKAGFVQKEIRHFPLEMGPSTVQESVYYPELLEMSLLLMKKLKWCGVVELEFMLDKTNQKINFMEINPRFWGSLQMAIYAGVDFPWLTYKLFTNASVEEAWSYKTGLKCRWLLPGDILHFLYNPKRLAMDPPIWAGKKQNVYDDILSWSDFFPAVGFLLAGIRYTADRDMWKKFFKR